MNILYSLLILSNIILFIGLFYYYSQAGVNFNLETFDYFSTVIPTVIILGFITSKLSRLREQGSTLYDVACLSIIAILGLMTSYFNGKANTSLLFGPYLEMFRILCVILIFILVAIRFKPFEEIIFGKFTKKSLFACFIIFTLLGLYASKFHLDVNNTPANVRCMVVMLSGLFGGPYVGIPVGLISGAYRFTLGGATALPCSISTVISGIVGSLIFIWNDKKFPKPNIAIILMFLYTGFEMLLIVILTPPDISFPFVRNIYPIMLFASVIGVILFSIVIKDKREQTQPSSIDEEIEEIETDLESNDEIKELRNEIEKIKNEIKGNSEVKDLKNDIENLKNEIENLKK